MQTDNLYAEGAEVSEDQQLFRRRRKSAGSIGNNESAFTPRVKTSLLGTSARQKLLQYKLAAQHAKAGTASNDKELIVEQVAQLQKSDHDENEEDFQPPMFVDHMKDLQVALIASEKAKKQSSSKARQLEPA